MLPRIYALVEPHGGGARGLERIRHDPFGAPVVEGQRFSLCNLSECDECKTDHMLWQDLPPLPSAVDGIQTRLFPGYHWHKAARGAAAVGGIPRVILRQCMPGRI